MRPTRFGHGDAAVDQLGDRGGELDQFGGDRDRPFRADALDLLEFLDAGVQQGLHGAEVAGQAPGHGPAGHAYAEAGQDP